MTANKTHSDPTTEELLAYAKELGIQSIHSKKDPETGLEAFIAVHNVDRGPAIGGCRFQPYADSNLALKDAIQLAHRMAIKSAVMDLPHGGAKAVIRVPTGNYDRPALFRGVGAFVEELNGDYITSLDAGTTPADMDEILKSTKHVIGATPGHPNHIDPSIYTAYGVFRSMVAALECSHGAANFTELTVAIQGAGHVATHLVNYLLEAGANIIITDMDQQALDNLPKSNKLKIVGVQDIYDVECNIFAPCALGAILNLESIKHLKCNLIAGAANNQLASEDIAQTLADNEILYLPDFVVNAGGVISASDTFHNKNKADIFESVDRIYHITKNILQRAQDESRLPVDIAMSIAQKQLKKHHG